MHQVCEAYPGISPLTIEDMTLDQLYCLWLDVEVLKTGRVTKKMTVEEAVSSGVIHGKRIGGKSLFQQAKERAAARAIGLDPTSGSKRERRKRRRQTLQQLAGHKVAE